MRQISAPENPEYATLQKVMNRLRAEGLPEPKKPDQKEYPDCPLDLASLGGDAVTQLHQEYIRWYEWVSWRATVADEAAKEWANGVKLLEKTLLKQEQLKKDEVELDPRLIAMRRVHQELSQEAAMLGTHKSKLDRYLKSTSRVIEVIRMNLERDRRGGNMQFPPWKD